MDCQPPPKVQRSLLDRLKDAVATMDAFEAKPGGATLNQRKFLMKHYGFTRDDVRLASRNDARILISAKLDEWKAQRSFRMEGDE